MNRLESIKDDVIKAIECEKETELDYYYDMDMGNHIKTLASDIEYLLQRLEIAQKALEEAYSIDGYMFVKEALDQLKEECKMNRLEEIKERFERRLLDEKETAYLIQRLERYENSLKEIAKLDCGSEVYPHVEIAKEALKDEIT